MYNIYTYVCIYVCMYVYVYVCKYVYIYIHIFIYTYMHMGKIQQTLGQVITNANMVDALISEELLKSHQYLLAIPQEYVPESRRGMTLGTARRLQREPRFLVYCQSGISQAAEGHSIVTSHAHKHSLLHCLCGYQVCVCVCVKA